MFMRKSVLQFLLVTHFITLLSFASLCLMPLGLYGQDPQSSAPNKAESNPPTTDAAVQNSANSNSANSNSANSDKAVSDGAASNEAASNEPLSNEEILALLEEPFLCNFQRATPINEVLVHITQTTGINIFFNRSAWESAGITSSTPVQFRLPFQIPLRDALDYLVRQLDAAWFVKDGRIELTSKEDGNLPVIRVYYIGDLIGMGSRPKNVETASAPASSQSTENSESAAKSDADPQTAQTADWETRLQGLENYLKTTVAPETWGNDAYYIKPHPVAGTLTIMQSASVHVRIEDFLQRLQQFNSIQIVFDCKLLTEDGYEQYPLIKCRNGGEKSIKIERSKDVILRIVPISPQASSDMIAPYKPLLVHIPRETKSIKVKGVARKENVIRVAVTVEDRKPETCLFQAVSVYDEDGEEYTRPRRPDIVAIDTQESPITKTYVVSELIRSGMKESDLSDVIKANIPPAAWQGVNTLVFDEEKNLVITQMPDVHRQIEELLTLIQERVKFQ